MFTNLEKVNRVRREFERHLDECPQCEKNPFGLCPEGRRIMGKMEGGE